MKNNFKKTKLQEWISLFEDKNKWKRVRELGHTRWVYLSPKTTAVLEFMIKGAKGLDYHDFGDRLLFSKKSKIGISPKQWGEANSEISKACTFYQLISLMLDDTYGQLKLQQFFQEKGMQKLNETLAKKNAKKIKIIMVDHSYMGSLKTNFHELEHLHIMNKNNRSKAMDLGNLNEGVELFYHENKLKILCEKISRTSYQTHVVSDDEKKWLEKISENIKHYPQIILYSLTYKMILNDDETYFGKLEKKLNLFLNDHLITKKYAKDFYEYLLVFCTRKINTGDFNFAGNYLTIFSHMLQEEIIYDNGNLPSWQFKNVIKGISKMLWLEDADEPAIFNKMDYFIKQHQNRLTPESSIPIISYCEAFVDYLKGNYVAAGKRLNGIKVSKDDLIKIEYNFLLMFIYLENNQRDEFIRATESMTSILHYSKKKLSELVLGRRKLAISFIKKVQKGSEGTKKGHFGECLAEITDSENFFGKDWLIAYLKRKLASRKPPANNNF